ncbi:MAG: hypothetical protein IPI67_27015 [Myxococcales bacterium]|nr:hypothetical protein [Myxococcales bacterium]
MNAPLETQALFAKLAVGDAAVLLGVQLVPLLLSESDEQADALLLEEGIASGQTQVNEIGEGGIVGQVRVLHRGVVPLLVLQGEQILGAKQNRSFNSSFLVEPGEEVVLPVSCVEQGRWRHTTHSFVAGATTLAPEIRARKLKRVSESIRMSGTYDSDQRSVWADVSEYMEATGTQSITSAYEDARKQRGEETEQALKSLEPLPGQVGLAVVRDGRVVLIDLFGSSRLFARAFQKCLRGTLADLPHEPGKDAEHAASAADTVRAALRELGSAETTRMRSPTNSETLTGSSGRVTYAAAVWKGAVYHCAAAG